MARHLRAWDPFALLHRRFDTLVQGLLQPEGGPPQIDFSRPVGEPALVAPDSVSWQVFRNPLTVFIGGVAAVVLELAEPRVRSGVWEHTSFREQPLRRLSRTGLAAMMTVYGPRSQTEAMIERITQMHQHVVGTTPEGVPYRASDPQLLTWVHATASFGFLEAYRAWVRPLDEGERDRFYAEGLAAARLYGASMAPGSQADLDALFSAWAPQLHASDTVFEFLRIVAHMPALPLPLRLVQPLLVRAAVELLPPWVHERLGLNAGWTLSAWQHLLLRRAVAMIDRLHLSGCPPAQACRRLGLPGDYLHRAGATQRQRAACVR